MEGAAKELLIHEQVRAIRANVTSAAALESISDLMEFLEASEYQLIQLMVANKIWTGSVPAKPSDEGDLEFGIVPYWVNNPPELVKKILADLPAVFRWIWNHVLAGALPTHIDLTNYHALLKGVEGAGLVGPDGTIYGEKTYEQLDGNWAYSLVDYLYSVHGPDGKAPFKSPPHITPISLEGKSADQVTIAVLGDWGTGPYSDNPSVEVMKQITALEPDYIVHLGDVYYAGTNFLYPPPGEEQRNFLDQWPTADQQKPGSSFTLNSNHEMYSGAHGYYDALKDSRFAAQKNASYFALKYGDWNLVGLDSSYFSTSWLVMFGSIGDAAGVQQQWLNGLGLDPSKTIVLTHHNAIEFDGSALTCHKGAELWSQVTGALGGDPAAWYWGHVHNGIVYKTPTCNGSKTRCRCLGHAAIPFGKATGLATPGVEFFTQTPNPNAGPPRVYNGFVLLTITSGGSVTEEYYEQHTNQVVYSSSYCTGPASSRRPRIRRHGLTAVAISGPGVQLRPPARSMLPDFEDEGALLTARK